MILELEAMALGIGAGAIVAVFFALTTPVWSTTVVGIAVIALLMAAVAAMFNAKTVDDINNTILK